MTDDANPRGVHCGLFLQPVNGLPEILGKARQRGEGITVATPVAARIEQKQGITGRMQRRGQRQHHFGITAPAMHDGQCR